MAQHYYVYKRFTFYIWQPVLHTVVFKTCGSYNGHSLQPKYVAAAKWIVQLVANNLACITQLHNIKFIYADCPHNRCDQIQKAVQKGDLYCL